MRIYIFPQTWFSGVQKALKNIQTQLYCDQISNRDREKCQVYFLRNQETVLFPNYSRYRVHHRVYKHYCHVFISRLILCNCTQHKCEMISKTNIYRIETKEQAIDVTKIIWTSPYNYTITWSYIWATTWQKQQNECVPSEDSDQPGHPPSLIRVFANMGS